MRYRTRVGAARLLTWIAFGVVVAADLSARRFPFWLALSAGVLIFLAFLPNYQWTYWEILADRLVEQRLLRRSVMMFVEVVALSPASLVSEEEGSQPQRIAVRGVAGRHMLIETPQARRFLKEMLEHLPPLPAPIPE